MFKNVNNVTVCTVENRSYGFFVIANNSFPNFFNVLFELKFALHLIQLN